MDVLIVAKGAFQTGVLKGIKDIAFNSTTQVYTLTKSDNSTVTYSAELYYLVLLWK